MSVKVEESTSAIDLYIHPLILINISDHYTRKKYQLKGSSGDAFDSKVVGILFGTQDGRRVEVRTSFELVFSVDKGGVVNIDHSYLQEKVEQCMLLLLLMMMMTQNYFSQFSIILLYILIMTF